MAGVLGVSCKKDEIFLALAQGGTVVDGSVEKIEAPALLEETERLQAIFDDVTRAVTEIEPEGVRILMPEQTYKDSYLRIAPRAALETVVRLAAQAAGIEVEMLHRNSARSRLGMPRSGKFDGHIAATVGEPVGRYWNAGRNLAAAAALAEA